MGLASVTFFLFSIATSGSLDVTYLLTLLMCMTSYWIGKSSFLNSSSSFTFLMYENSFSESSSLIHSIYWFWLLFIILSTEWFKLMLLVEDWYSSSSAAWPFVECFFEGASSLETRSTYACILPRLSLTEGYETRLLTEPELSLLVKLYA